VTLSEPEAHPLGVSFAYEPVTILLADMPVDTAEARDSLPPFMAEVTWFLDSTRRLTSTSAPTSVSCSSTVDGWQMSSVENLVPPSGIGNTTSYYALSCSNINAVTAAAFDGTNWVSGVDHDGWSWDCSGAPAFGGVLQGGCEVDAWPPGEVPGTISITGTK